MLYLAVSKFRVLASFHWTPCIVDGGFASLKYVQGDFSFWKHDMKFAAIQFKAPSFPELKITLYIFAVHADT